MTEDECRLAAQIAREAMMHELTHPGKRNYEQMSKLVEQTVFDKLMTAKEGR